MKAQARPARVGLVVERRLIPWYPLVMTGEWGAPEARTVHRRFAIALLGEALAQAGTLHIDYRVDVERETIRSWVPRRSANDPEPLPAPAKDPHQRLAGGLLEAAGMRPVDVEVGGGAEWVGFYFEPARSGGPAPGLLGRMTATKTILSPFHVVPGPHEAEEEMRKALDLWQMKRRQSKAKKPDVQMPETWLIGTSLEKGLLEGLWLKPKEDWPAGMYFGAPMLAIHAVALGELPVSPETLLLRLLGTGDVLERALREQAALPADSPVRGAVRAALAAALPAEGEPVPIEDATRDPVLRACKESYRRWAREA